MMTDDFDPLWSDPPAIYRGAPFWSWNALLDPDRLRRQIRSLHEGGMGGFFMHSRYGLKTPYLSDTWFQCVGACIEEARALNMKAYLYDEDRWPSGSAGGELTREHADFRQHLLAAVDAAELGEDELVEGAFLVELDGEGRLVSYRAADDDEPAPEGLRKIAFVVRLAPTSGWYNDGSYMDTMNPQAVAEFLHGTHQAYADRFAGDFGRVVPAIFTDEPNYGFNFSETGRTLEGWVQWTPAAPREFSRRRGYDLRGRLPELIWPAADEAFSRVRYDFRRTLTELFVESFSAQIGQWCAQHGIALTGHVLMENTPQTQVAAVGAAMPHYEHMQWPGIDILCDQSDELATAKQCTSVADQLGRERVLSELYGCTGWDWPLEGHKYVGDWQYAVGVNFRCVHLSHYSLAGGAKRDYPASILDHSPWWKYYRCVEDYFARLGVMLTQGAPLRDVLVVHPIESAWGLYTPPADGRPSPPGEALRDLQDSLATIIRTLSGEHYDWDFADESLLDRHGRVDGGAIHVGRMAYKVAVVPPTVTLRASTVDLLGRLIEAGGSVLFLGRAPDRINGQADPEIAELVDAARCAGAAPEEFLPVLAEVLPRRVSIREGGGQLRCVWAMLREVDGGRVLFLQSHDRAAPHRVTVDVEGQGPVVLWDPRSGRRTRLEAEVRRGRAQLELPLEPTGSALLTLGLPVTDADQASPEPQALDTRTLEGPFEIELAEPNTLPLDYCRWRFPDEAGAAAEFSGLMPTLKADQLIRAKFGLAPRIGREHQPWYLYATGRADTSPRGRCEMLWTFHVTDVPVECSLALESPHDFEITVNGRGVGPIRPAGEDTGYWADEDIRTVEIASLLQPGENEVLLRFDYRVDMELEDLYLVGGFGVARRGETPPAPGAMTLVAPPKQLAAGSWVGQGLDFYGGAVLYRLRVDAPAPGRRLRLRMPDLACTAAAVHVGKETYVLPWAPFEVDVTDALTPGTNQVTLEVIGGRKNILGPLHTPWERGTGPNHFSPDHPQWRDEYCLTDHGLMGAVVVETLQ